VSDVVIMPPVVVTGRATAAPGPGPARRRRERAAARRVGNAAVSALVDEETAPADIGLALGLAPLPGEGLPAAEAEAAEPEPELDTGAPGPDRGAGAPEPAPLGVIAVPPDEVPEPAEPRAPAQPAGPEATAEDVGVPPAPAAGEPVDARSPRPATGAIDSPADLVDATRSAATAVPSVGLGSDRAAAPLGALVARGRAASATRRGGVGGGGRIPPPRPVDPAEIDPVPRSTDAIQAAKQAPLDQVTLPDLVPMPDGGLPVLEKPPGIDQEELGKVEAPPPDPAGVVADTEQKLGAEQQRRSAAVAKGKSPPAAEPVTMVEVEPPVLVEFRRPPPPPVPQAQGEADAANVARALALVITDIVKVIDDIVNEARRQAFPPDKLATYFPQVGTDLKPTYRTELEAAVDKLRDAVELSTEQLDAAVAARRDELVKKAAGQQVQREAVATAAGHALTAEARKELARQERERRRKEAKRVARLRSALWSSRPELVDELLSTRLGFVDDDVAKGVVAHEAAGARRLELLTLYEQAYRDAYRRADTNWQRFGTANPQPDAPPPTDPPRRAPNTEDGKVWYDVVTDQLAVDMRTRREATTTNQKTLVDALRDAGTRARAALREWAAKRLRRKVDADTAQREAAEDAAHQDRAIQAARDEAAQAGTRDRLLGQVRFAAVVYDQARWTDQQRTEAGARALTQEQLELGKTFLQSGGDPADPMSAVAGGIKAEFAREHLPTAAETVRKTVLAIDPKDQAEVMNLAEVIFPNGSEGLDTRQQKLWKAFETWKGTDEDTVYDMLSGLDAKQTQLLKLRYKHMHKGEDLDWRIADEMSDAEKDRALGLLEGDKVKTAKAMVELSDGWLSDDKDLAISAIEMLPPGQASQLDDPKTMATLRKVMTGGIRRVRYGQYVEDDRAMQQVDTLLELDKARGRQLPGTEPTPEMRGLQAKADALAFDRAMRDSGGGDIDKMTKVFDRMREDLRRDPRTADLPTEEFEAELRRRTRRMENAYGEIFGHEYRGSAAPDAMQQAIRESLEWQERVDLVQSMVAVDQSGELAARIQISPEGVIAADNDINNSLALNYERAAAEVERDPRHRSEVAVRLAAELEKREREKGSPLTPDERTAYRKEVTEGLTLEVATATFEGVTGRFEARYGDRWKRFGDPDKSGLENMLIATTEFSGEKEALTRLRHGGGLLLHEQVYFGVSGYGMDREQVLGAFEGRTKEQIDRASAKYRDDFHEDMEERLLAESSGRDRFDVKEALRGVPRNEQELMERLERRLEYETTTYFPSTRTAVAGALVGPLMAGTPQEREEAVGGERAIMVEQVERARERYRELNAARESGDPELARRAEAAFYNQSGGVFRAADGYRKAVDDYVDGKVQIIAAVAAIVATAVVLVATGGTAAPAIVALAASLAGTAATIATKYALLGSAYGWHQFKTDAIIGIVDAVVSVATARLGDVILKVPKATGVGRAAIQQSMRQIAAQRAAKPIVARAGAQVVEQFAQAAPTALVAGALDRKNWKGDVLGNIGGGALFAGFSGIAVGTVVSQMAHHAPRVLGAVADGIGALKRSGGAEIAADTVVLRSSRELLDDAAIPRDRLLNQGTPTERAAAYRAYRSTFPDASMDDFLAAVERGTASMEVAAEQVRLLQREMQREMLAGIPAAERGQHARTPIIVLSDVEFTARTGSEARGQAATLVVNGEPVVVVREGAPLTALREEGKHVRQIRDRINAERVALLDEARLANWKDLSLEERMRSWHAKLDLEIEAQHQMIRELDAEVRSGKLSEARVSELRERLDDARAALEVFEGRRRQLAGIADEAAEAMSRKQLEPPGFLDEPARLFNKTKKGKGPPAPATAVADPTPDPFKLDPTLEATSDPNVFLGRIETDPVSKKQRRWVYEYRWPSIEEALRGVRAEKITVGEIRYSGSRKIWVTSGEKARFAGGLAEMAAKMETAAKMGTDASGVKRVQFDAQTARGTGFDDVIFELRQGKDGQPVARVVVVEVKDYGDGTVYTFTAIDDNIVKNVKLVEQRLEDLITARRWADLGLDELEARAALKAVRERRLDIEIRTAADTKIPRGYEDDLQASLSTRKDLYQGVPGGTPRDIKVRRGEHIDESEIAAAEPYWVEVERMRLGGLPGWTDADVVQFRDLATRPAGVTPRSLEEAGALMMARDHPSGLIAGKMEVAPGGRHFLDARGPIAFVQPRRSTTGSFYLPAIARGILETAQRQLPTKGGLSALPRVVIDVGHLKSYEAGLLEVYLSVQANATGRQDLLARIVIVGRVP
jgi:hypothetical protein